MTAARACRKVGPEHRAVTNPGEDARREPQVSGEWCACHNGILGHRFRHRTKIMSFIQYNSIVMDIEQNIVHSVVYRDIIPNIALKRAH